MAGPSTTKAETNQRVATKKAAIAKTKLAEVHDHAKDDGYASVWPGSIPRADLGAGPGERRVVLMNGRCRLPSWTAADDLPTASPGDRSDLSVTRLCRASWNGWIRPAKRDVLRRANLFVRKRPNLARLGDKDRPVKIGLRAVVEEKMGKPLALRGVHR